MRVLITGSVGFIGSALSQSLLESGHEVVGVDSFLDSYPRAIKENRLDYLRNWGQFTFVESSIVDLDWPACIGDVECVFHLAAQAGVRTSWGNSFKSYTDNNILATQRLLEEVKNSGVKRFVCSSSSSVYGNSEVVPTPEDAHLRPISPYAVSKLAGEHLCNLYYENFGIDVVSLRYFTVFGPQPRPDQAVCIFTRALLEDRGIQVFGDGNQMRGMTYIDDVVRANRLASEKDCVGEIFNIGGGVSITVNQLIGHLEEITEKAAKVNYVDKVKGDANNTIADISKANRLLGWQPSADLVEGLEKTVDSIRKYYYEN